MEAQTITVTPDLCNQDESLVKFFVFSGSLEPAFVTMQEIDSHSVIEAIYASPQVYNDRQGVAVTVQFQGEEQARGRTFKLSLLQKGLQQHPTVTPYE